MRPSGVWAIVIVTAAANVPLVAVYVLGLAPLRSAPAAFVVFGLPHLVAGLIGVGASRWGGARRLGSAWLLLAALLLSFAMTFVIPSAFEAVRAAPSAQAETQFKACAIAISLAVVATSVLVYPILLLDRVVAIALRRLRIVVGRGPRRARAWGACVSVATYLSAAALALGLGYARQTHLFSLPVRQWWANPGFGSLIANVYFFALLPILADSVGRAGAVALVLRRFGTGSAYDGWRSRWHVCDLLGAALVGIGSVVSLQDDSYPGPPTAREALLIGACVGLPLVLLLNESGLPHGLVSLLGLPLAFLSFQRRRLYRLVGRRLPAPQPVASQSDLDALGETLTRLNAGRAGVGRNRAISSTDAAWQSVVLAVLAKASCVVIDISAASENVAWEVRQVAARCPPGGVILCWPDGRHYGARTLDDVPAGVRNALEGALSTVPAVFRQRSRGFCYPARRPLILRRVLVAVALAREVAAAIAAFDDQRVETALVTSGT